MRRVQSPNDPFGQEFAMRMWVFLRKKLCGMQKNKIFLKLNVFLDCKICIHEQCRKRAPMPCLPPASFPTPGRNADSRIPLRGYCPTLPPYIPGLLIRCICALEKDRLNTEGIYRIPGFVTLDQY